MTRLKKGLLVKPLCAKVRSVRGESLTEVLVSILVSGLAILMLGMAISAATDTNLHSKKAMDDYYKANNDIATLSNSEGSSAVTLREGPPNGSGQPVNLNNSTVYFYSSEGFDSTPVVSYNVNGGTS